MAAAMPANDPRPQILFVDDEQRVLNSMRIMFRREYGLHLAASGSEALDIVQRIPIDVIVADHRMPQMTGVEVLTSHRSVELPESSAEKLPHETVVVTVSATEILVGGRAVASVADALATEDDLIAPLKAELDLQASRSVLGADGSRSQAVTILGDKDIPYRLLRKVMVTASRANYSDVAFAVTRKATT